VDAAELARATSAWMSAMRRGDFEAAWRVTDRLEEGRRGGALREPHHLVWDGRSFEDREVLVRCEHGLGDTIQFARYVPRLRDIARDVTFLVQPQLVRLFDGACEFGSVHDGWSFEPSPHDVEIEVMELAYAFRSTADTLPKSVPYLPVTRLAAFSHDLPPLERRAFRVGVLWAASEWDTTRSIPLELLQPLAEIEGVLLYSLQQGSERDAYRTAPFALEPLSHHTAAIESAAAAMLELDLVVTVDAMPAHLAGALGRPTWVLLKHDADWRWMDARTDTPWYPTVRLYRQPRPGDWDAVVERITLDLDKLARGNGAG
jgi:hypothetical protein